MSNKHQTEHSLGYDIRESDEYDEDPHSTQRERKAPKSKGQELRQNFSAVFGQGIGRLTLVVALIVVLIMIALGVRSLTSKEETIESNNAQFEVPSTPNSSNDARPISQKEADRRNAVAAEEGEQAIQSGDSYQPPFMPNIETERQPEAVENIFGSHNTQLPPETMPFVHSNAAAEEQRAMESARRRQEQEYAQEIQKRDAYIKAKEDKVLAQFDKILLGDSLNKLGVSSTQYFPQKSESKTETEVNQSTAIQNTVTRKELIKTGNTLYAESLFAINTDKGTEAIAVIRGGVWDGSHVIGRIESRPENIGIIFHTLAPQDSRPSMRINAMALRTEDASPGIAENIDHHTLERYSALAFSSLLSGYGKSYENASGTSVIAPSGTVVNTTEDPSSRQIIGKTVGELGTAFSQEVQRGFNRPSTYSSKAGQGFAVYFLDDVYAD